MASQLTYIRLAQNKKRKISKMNNDELGALFRVDKKFILNPSKWPNWPILPMKKSDGHGDNSYALLVEIGAGDTWQRTLYLNAVLFAVKGLNEYEKKVYDSIDAMLNDGWIID
jgi:hypothetical protein